MKAYTYNGPLLLQMNEWILTVTNHHEFGLKMARDKKPMPSGGLITWRCRWLIMLKGGQWKPILKQVQIHSTYETKAHRRHLSILQFWAESSSLYNSAHFKECTNMIHRGKHLCDCNPERQVVRGCTTKVLATLPWPQTTQDTMRQDIVLQQCEQSQDYSTFPAFSVAVWNHLQDLTRSVLEHEQSWVVVGTHCGCLFSQSESTA